MLFQIIGSDAFRLNPVPFNAGFYTIKILRLDLRQSGTSASYDIILKSSKLLSKHTQYTGTSGGFLDIKHNYIIFNVKSENIISPTLDSQAYNAYDKPYTFRNVYLDGYIDTEYRNAGIGIGTYDTPPFALAGGLRFILSLDIEPEEPLLLNDPYQSKRFLPFIIQCFVNQRQTRVNLPLNFYGKANVNILRLDYNTTNLASMTLLRLRSDTIRNAGGGFLTCFNDFSKFPLPDNFPLSDVFGKNLLYKNVDINGYIDFTLERVDGNALGANDAVLISMEIEQTE